ncbi:hypothetical protein MFIFM68171_03637 [Madurella fahalii]|uniref:YCII-related domain-containing protein n=1 Tax=Madurella fahalii TaxID=1157608 RepID=A0ABQ0G6R4_9PEZI
MPKFAMLVRATADAESGELPHDMTKLLEDMLAYNASLIDAGALIHADGFLPSSKGARVQFSSTAAPTVTYGPFDAPSLVSGYWIINTANLDEAISWAKKVPFKTDDAVVEVRQIAGADDFGDKMTDELKAKEATMKEKLGEK